MANEYRDLTKDDVLQAGDVFYYLSEERPIFTIWIGEKAGQYRHKFRRPIKPAEITAAERLKFEAWMASHASDEYRERYIADYLVRWYGDEDCDDYGSYSDEDTDLSWKVWCAALGIDPTADLNGGE